MEREPHRKIFGNCEWSSSCTECGFALVVHGGNPSGLGYWGRRFTSWSLSCAYIHTAFRSAFCSWLVVAWLSLRPGHRQAMDVHCGAMCLAFCQWLPSLTFRTGYQLVSEGHRSLQCTFVRDFLIQQGQNTAFSWRVCWPHWGAREPAVTAREAEMHFE